MGEGDVTRCSTYSWGTKFTTSETQSRSYKLQRCGNLSTQKIQENGFVGILMMGKPVVIQYKQMFWKARFALLSRT